MLRIDIRAPSIPLLTPLSNAKSVPILAAQPPKRGYIPAASNGLPATSATISCPFPSSCIPGILPNVCVVLSKPAIPPLIAPISDPFRPP